MLLLVLRCASRRPLTTRQTQYSPSCSALVSSSSASSSPASDACLARSARRAPHNLRRVTSRLDSSVVKMLPKLESAECSGERTAHALRTSPKIVDHHMPTHDIRRADVEHRWTRARSSSSHAGHDYRLHHSGDGFECVRSFDASWPWRTAGRSPRTARHKLEPLAVLHLLRAPQGSPRQRPMPQEPAPPAPCAPAGPRQGVSDPSPDAPARSAWERA